MKELTFFLTELASWREGSPSGPFLIMRITEVTINEDKCIGSFSEVLSTNR